MKNLWGDELPPASPVRPPNLILEQQAELLARMTNGLIYGGTELDRTGSCFEVYLYIVAPSLANYRYQVLHARYDIALYPAEFFAEALEDDQAWKEGKTCADEHAFEAAVSEVLQSQRVRNVIRGLLAQMRRT